MSRDTRVTALRQALRSEAFEHFAYARGPLVVLVLNATPLRDRTAATGLPEGRADVYTLEASSAAMARKIAARAVSDLRTFGAPPKRSLEISELYAEAVWRFAQRRAR